MNISDNDLQELSRLMQQTGDDITLEYHYRGSEILENIGLFSELKNDGPVPLEVWTGIVQAVADASGYRVILQAAIMEPIEDCPDMMRTVGQREIVAVEPTLFVKEG